MLQNFYLFKKNIDILNCLIQISNVNIKTILLFVRHSTSKKDAQSTSNLLPDVNVMWFKTIMNYDTIDEN